MRRTCSPRRHVSVSREGTQIKANWRIKEIYFSRGGINKSVSHCKNPGNSVLVFVKGQRSPGGQSPSIITPTSLYPDDNTHANAGRTSEGTGTRGRTSKEQVTRTNEASSNVFVQKRQDRFHLHHPQDQDPGVFRLPGPLKITAATSK